MIRFAAMCICTQWRKHYDWILLIPCAPVVPITATEVTNRSVTRSDFEPYMSWLLIVWEDFWCGGVEHAGSEQYGPG